MKTLNSLAISLIGMAAVHLASAQPVPIPPTNQVCSLGADAAFQVRISVGTPPYTFAWEHNDIRIDPGVNPSAATTRLTLTNVSLPDAGRYRAVVTDATGTTTTDPAELRVDTTFTKITQGALVTDREPSGGAAWGDYDNDGRLDLFVPNTGGTYLNSLYRNLGGDEFVKVTNALTTALPGWTWGAQWADMDNDGDLDLFLLRPFAGSGYPNNQVRNEFFRNEGGGVFRPMTNAATSIKGLWTGLTLLDHDGDGWLDLFATTQAFTAGQPLDDYFWRNLADGRFEAWTTNDVGVVLKPNAKTAAPAWCDIDGDGDLDLYISKYGGQTNFLYRNDGGRMVPVTAGSLPARRSTWGAAWADFNNDGLFDLFTGGENGTNTLHLNRGNWVFEDVTAASGLALSGNVYTVAVGDFDNDGDLDLYVPVYDRVDVLYVNRGDGTFDRADVGSPLTEGVQNGAVWVDYNNDGFLDLFEFCGDGTPALNLLYRNSLPQHGNGNHWLKLRLRGMASNASAIGARVWAKATIGGKETWQVRQLGGDCLGPTSPGPLRIHFGLGDATTVDLVRVEWPSGNVQELTQVDVDAEQQMTEVVHITPNRPSASLNGSVTLTRNAVPGATYQWRFDGGDLPHQTNRTLTLSGVTAPMTGRYSVVLSDAALMATNFVHLAVDTTFTKVTTDPVVTDLGSAWGPGWGDYDRDGDQDLLVTRQGNGRNVLYQNNGDGTFVRASSAYPTQADAGGQAIMADFDNSGWPDFFCPGNGHPTMLYYSENGQSFSPVPFFSFTFAYNLSVVDYDRDARLDVYFTSAGAGLNRLFRNLGGRVFEERPASEVGALLNVGTWGGACWADYDDDGWVDVYAPELQAGRNYLFRNQNGRFTRVNNSLTAASMPAIAGAWGDYDNDGRVDLAVACFGGTSRLYRNLGDGQFEAATIGVTLSGNYNSASWADYDNDGFLDLFMTYGNALGNSLLRNNGNGTFTRVVTGSIPTEKPIGGAGSYNGLWFDANNDGFLDLYVSNGDDAGAARTENFYYVNRRNGNHWLQVRLVGTTSNPQGVGAKVRAQAQIESRTMWQRRDITGGDVWSGNQTYACFGLGDSTNVTTLRIEWPSGTMQELTNVSADQILTIIEPRRPVLAITVTPAGVTGTVTGDPNTSYQVAVCDDLAAGWTPLATATTDANGRASWADPGPAAQGRRFYRARR